MKNNPLDDIIKCNIEISSPASGDVSFGSILMVVPEPEVKIHTMLKVTALAKADDLMDFGFEVDDVAYKAAITAFSQNPAPNELYVCVRERSGEDELGKYESITDTLIRAASEVTFYGVYLAGFDEKVDVQEAISWTESNEKLFAFEYTDIENCPVINFSYYRSFGLFSGLADGYGTNQPEENKYAALAWMAKCFGYDPGTETWNLKELATIVPSGLNTNQKKALKDTKINTFLRFSGCNVAIGGYTLGGEWIDVIRFRDWLKNEIQLQIFNSLRCNRKVPFTDAGIGMLEGIIESVLKKGQEIGGIAPTEYSNDNKAIPGFSVKVPKASDLTEIEKKSRKLSGCRWTAKLAGAIHAVDIEGFLTF